MCLRNDFVPLPRPNRLLVVLIIIVALAACDRFNHASIVVATHRMSLAEVDALEKTLMALLAEQGGDCLLQPAAAASETVSYDCPISGTGIVLDYSRSPFSLAVHMDLISDGFRPEPASFREARKAVATGLIEAAGVDRVEVRHN